MPKHSWISTLTRSKVVVVIRGKSSLQALQLGRISARSGLSLLEITWNTPDAHLVISQLKQEFPHCLVGAGTILSEDMAQKAMDWGSDFLFSPAHDAKVIETAHKSQIPIVAGALTPSEILLAWQRGADAVKVFPIANLGGASYLRAIKPVLPEIPLVPTGGVSLDNLTQLLNAGAVAVGMSGYLFPPDRVLNQDWELITDRVQRVVEWLGFPADHHIADA